MALRKRRTRALAPSGRLDAGRKTTMYSQILNSPGELFLGSDRETALALGSRHFRSAAKAIAFAVEHAAPVSLRGAMLRVGDQTFERKQIIHLHEALTDGAITH